MNTIAGEAVEQVLEQSMLDDREFKMKKLKEEFEKEVQLKRIEAEKEVQLKKIEAEKEVQLKKLEIEAERDNPCALWSYLNHTLYLFNYTISLNAGTWIERMIESLFPTRQKTD